MGASSPRIDQDSLFPFGGQVGHLEIIRALREACIAAEPIVRRYGNETPNERDGRMAREAEDLIDYALALGDDTPSQTYQQLFIEVLGKLALCGSDRKGPEVKSMLAPLGGES